MWKGARRHRLALSHADRFNPLSLGAANLTRKVTPNMQTCEWLFVALELLANGLGFAGALIHLYIATRRSK